MSSNLSYKVIHNADLKYNGRNGTKSWRNFAGDATLRNAAGNRYFTFVPTEDDAREMEAAGWPVRWIQKYGAEDGVVEPIVTVTVKFRTRDGRPMRPPKIVVISGRNQIEYGENEVALLDSAQFEKVDMQISYYEAFNPSTGGQSPKVGLDTMFATLRRDELTEEYAARAMNEDAPF
mgnify:CR=1 FL=1